jgi:hypothetical protein
MLFAREGCFFMHILVGNIGNGPGDAAVASLTSVLLIPLTSSAAAVVVIIIAAVLLWFFLSSGCFSHAPHC